MGTQGKVQKSLWMECLPNAKMYVHEKYFVCILEEKPTNMEHLSKLHNTENQSFCLSSSSINIKIFVLFFPPLLCVRCQAHLADVTIKEMGSALITKLLLWQQ